MIRCMNIGTHAVAYSLTLIQFFGVCTDPDGWKWVDLNEANTPRFPMVGKYDFVTNVA